MKYSGFLRLSASLIALFSAFSIAVNAQNAGSLDTTFGSGGIATTQLNTTATVYDAVVQPDKKVVVVGLTFPPQVPATFGMAARFNENGTLDTTFNGTGYNAQISLKSANSVALQPDGKIVVGGYCGSGNGHFCVARLNSNGSYDTTFNGTGFVMTTVGIGSTINSVSVLPDGKIIAVGFTALQTFFNRDYAMVKYNADGSLDTTFGTGGRVATELGSNEFAYDSAIQSDGKIVVVGDFTDTLSGQVMAAIVRYNANGSIDTAFGNSGKAFRSAAAGAKANQVAIQSDGKIIIVGDSIPPTRYNSNGTFDTAFNSSVWNLTRSITIQTDGKILVGGADSANNNALVRYNSEGTPDTGFGTNGKVSTLALVEAIAIAPNGRIVTAGTRSNNNFEIVLTRYFSRATNRFSLMDYDGDDKADVSVFRASVGGWYVSRSSDNAFFGTTLGQTGDAITPADFDGDGKTDVSVFRQGNWYRLNSSNGSFTAVNFGLSTDLSVPADFDGDGKADISVFRPSNGSWYRLNSSNGAFVGTSFGTNGDKPLIGDFDGDGKADIGVFRPSTGAWYRLNSSNGAFVAVNFGISEDKPVPADYDGDGKADVAVFRPSNGTWYRLNSSNGAFEAVAFGTTNDLPTAADFDGDGKADVAVFRPSNGTWYLNRSTQGFAAQTFGANGDIPTPNAFVR